MCIRKISGFVLLWGLTCSSLLRSQIFYVYRPRPPAFQRAEDEAQWVAQEVTLTLKIREMVSKGLVRRRRGRRGVGRGRRKRRLEGRERQRGRQEQMRRAWEREGWRRAELQWAQRQDARWRSKGGKGASWRLRQRKQRRRRLATASNAMQRLPARMHFFLFIAPRWAHA